MPSPKGRASPIRVQHQFLRRLSWRHVGGAALCAVVIWAAIHVAVGSSGTLAVPGVPVALDLGVQLTDQNLDAIWVLDRGGFSTVSPRSEGGGSVTHRTQLPPGTDPVAIDSDGTRALILDRATNAVLVFDGDEDAGFSLSATLPVGDRPSALDVWDFNGDGEYRPRGRQRGLR